VHQLSRRRARRASPRPEDRAALAAAS
jgi:hypothetical protein